MTDDKREQRRDIDTLILRVDAIQRKQMLVIILLCINIAIAILQGGGVGRLVQVLIHML